MSAKYVSPHATVTICLYFYTVKINFTVFLCPTQSLARVIGADKRRDGYLEGGGYLVSWCVGHLVELSAPERYDERFANWRLEDLPILPERWLYEVSQATGKQYQILKSLMERADVTSLVCAT